MAESLVNEIMEAQVGTSMNIGHMSASQASLAHEVQDTAAADPQGRNLAGAARPCVNPAHLDPLPIRRRATQTRG